MSFEQSGPSRRALLVAAALLPLAGCDADGRSASASSPTPGGRSASSPDSSQFAALERKHGARLGVYALATSTGATVAYRARGPRRFGTLDKCCDGQTIRPIQVRTNWGEVDGRS
jgi:beta-lactamase class A